jgi:uncharacterized BrkB/YihY/UPF0761 family membrane protein
MIPPFDDIPLHMQFPNLFTYDSIITHFLGIERASSIMDYAWNVAHNSTEWMIVPLLILSIPSLLIFLAGLLIMYKSNLVDPVITYAGAFLGFFLLPVDLFYLGLAPLYLGGYVAIMMYAQGKKQKNQEINNDIIEN